MPRHHRIQKNLKYRSSLWSELFVVYDKKYGTTKLAGENISEGKREAESIETSIGYVKEINIRKFLLMLGWRFHPNSLLLIYF
ncbi:MAG: hypothetical protein ABSA75_04715 [Candidatus Bathyarchaeia archaeon]|jgi:hypothetical protein